MSEFVKAVLVRRFTAENPRFAEEYYYVGEGEYPYICRRRCHYAVGDNRGDMKISP